VDLDRRGRKVVGRPLSVHDVPVGSAAADVDFFAVQTQLTSIGGHAALAAGLDASVRRLRDVPQDVTLHFRQAAAAGIDAAERRDEARFRQVARMVQRIFELDARSLADARDSSAKLIGHCRTSAVLLTALLREKGWAARPRAGFSAYWQQSMRTGHWVTEYWSQAESRWLIADGDLNAEWVRRGDLRFDLCDVPREKFVLSGDAWLTLRAGEDEPLTFGEDPDCFGLEYVRAQLLRDVACLTGTEVGAWDRWGVGAARFAELDARDLELIDELARSSTTSHPREALVCLIADHEQLAVPPEIGLDDPAADVYMVDVPDLWRRTAED
jgi:Transglutaminase-like superfamily